MGTHVHNKAQHYFPHTQTYPATHPHTHTHTNTHTLPTHKHTSTHKHTPHTHTPTHTPALHLHLDLNGGQTHSLRHPGMDQHLSYGAAQAGDQDKDAIHEVLDLRRECGGHVTPLQPEQLVLQDVAWGRGGSR